MDKHQTTLLINKDEYETLRNLCFSKRISMNSFIQAAIQEKLAKEKKEEDNE